MAKRINTIDLINDLKRVAVLQGRSPTRKEYDDNGRYGSQTIKKRFGSWGKALSAANLKQMRHLMDGRGLKVCKSEVVADLRKVTALLGHLPSPTQYREHGAISLEVLYESAAARKWGKVLEYFLGIELTSDQMRQFSSTRKIISLEVMRATIQSLYLELNRAPTTHEYRQRGFNSYSLQQRLKTDWEGVLKWAGISPREQKRSVLTRKSTADDCVNDLVLFAKLTNRKVTRNAYRGRGKFSVNTVVNKCGSWSAAAARANEILNGTGQKQLGHVPDPVRDKLKTESVGAIKEFFSNRNASASLPAE